MKLILSILFLALGLHSEAQFSKASLQASGLTCSMCSKAVKVALEEVPFVEKVQVDIKNQQYNMTFKGGSTVQFDALSKAVEDAGFSVAGLKVTADLNAVTAAKDEHIQIGNMYFHFLNGDGKQLNGATTFSLVDKGFVQPKEFKKYSARTKMKCLQTGKAEGCCTEDQVPQAARVYHAII